MKILSALLIALFFVSMISAQSPASFKYQAVARNSINQPLANHNVKLKISLLKGSVSGTEVYSETHSAVSSDLGLLNVSIGQGQVVLGTTLNDINWAAGPYFIKTEMDVAGGNNFVTMGTSQILSVPYALYAEKTGNNDDADADPTNEIQNLTYDNSTQELEISKGNKIILPAIDDADADPNNENQTLSFNPTSQELSISNGNKVVIPYSGGGGLVGSLIKDTDGNTRVQVEKIANEDKVRFYIQDTNVVIFRVNNTKTLMMETFDPGSNTFIGAGAGQKNVINQDSTQGLFNTVLGNLAGSNNSKGSRNTFLGRGAGKLNNIAHENVFVGMNSGTKMQTGGYNTFIGTETGAHMTTGQFNVFIGNTTGGVSNASGSNNVFVGTAAGASSEGSNNVFLGYNAGRYEKGDNKLYIDNNSGDKPLIYGDFLSNIINVNGKLAVGIATPTSEFHVAHGNTATADGFTIENTQVNKHFWRFFTSNQVGDLFLYTKNGGATAVATINSVTGAYSNLSDERKKRNIQPLTNVLDKLNNLDAKTYLFQENKDSDKHSIGFLAQDVEKSFPELVSYSSENDVYHVNYGGLAVVSIQAIKEQQATMEKQKTEINTLQNEMLDLKTRLEKLEKLLKH